MLSRLADVQRHSGWKPLPVEDVALNLKAIASELVAVTELELKSNGRNLVSASLLADMLMQVSLYCTARGWDADRLVDLADSKNKHSAVL